MIYLEVLLSLDSLMKLEFLIDCIYIVIGKLGILPKPIEFYGNLAVVSL